MAEIPKTSESLIKALGKNASSLRWAEFAEIYTPLMRDFCKGRFPDLDAEDLVQEALISLVKVLPNYQYDPEARGHFHNYLMGIIKNKAFTIYTKQKKKRNAEANWTHTRNIEERNKEEEDFSQAKVEIAIRELLADPTVHEKTKQIFKEVAIVGRPPVEVAEAFGVTRNCVDQIRSRMTTRLREIVNSLHIE